MEPVSIVVAADSVAKLLVSMLVLVIRVDPVGAGETELAAEVVSLMGASELEVFVVVCDWSIFVVAAGLLLIELEVAVVVNSAVTLCTKKGISKGGGKLESGLTKIYSWRRIGQALAIIHNGLIEPT